MEVGQATLHQLRHTSTYSLYKDLWVGRDKRETHEIDAHKNKNTPHWQKNFNKVGLN